MVGSPTSKNNNHCKTISVPIVLNGSFMSKNSFEALSTIGAEDLDSVVSGEAGNATLLGPENNETKQGKHIKITPSNRCKKNDNHKAYNKSGKILIQNYLSVRIATGETEGP